MSKFKDSAEALDTSLLLWPGLKHTNTSVSEVYDLLVYPQNSIIQGPGQTIFFNIPAQETGFLHDVEVHAKFRIKKANANLPAGEQVSIVNNISGALFSLVEAKIDDRINLLQQMSQSYGLCSLIEKCLSNDPNRADILYTRELFVMDTGDDKAQSQDGAYVISGTVTEIHNKGAGKRALSISESKPCSVVSKLNIPLLRQHKGILPKTRISVNFTLNKNEYIILSKTTGAKYTCVLDDLYLKATYIKPQPALLQVINDKLDKNPVIYEFDKQTLVARLLPAGSRNFTINNIFDSYLPKFVCFCLQTSSSMAGSLTTNNNTFYPIKSLNLWVNNKPFFAKALTNAPVELLDQIYKTTRRDLKGASLITADNLALYQFFTLCLTNDRTFDSHYGLTELADTRLEIDLGEVSTRSYLLLAYCLTDSLMEISKEGSVKVIQ